MTMFAGQPSQISPWLTQAQAYASNDNDIHNTNQRHHLMIFSHLYIPATKFPRTSTYRIIPMLFIRPVYPNKETAAYNRNKDFTIGHLNWPPDRVNIPVCWKGVYLYT